MIKSQLTVLERCQVVSEHPPSEWPREVLDPLYKEPVTIFGHAQIAMARNLKKPLIEALVDTGLSESNGQARIAIKNNAVMVNRVKVYDITKVLSSSDALANLDAIVIENGRYNFGIIELCEAML